MTVSPWTALRGRVNGFLPDGYYTAYALSPAEHVRTLPCSVPHLEQALREAGYRSQRLSAAKRHPDTGRLHDLSMRRVPEEHPDAVNGTRLAAWSPRECQYHVHAFSVTGGVWVASHYELRPDFLRPRPDVARLREHYKPEYGATYHRGVHDLTGLTIW